LVNIQRAKLNGNPELLRQVSCATYLASRIPINNRFPSSMLDYDRLYHDLRMHAPNPEDSIVLE